MRHSKPYKLVAILTLLSPAIALAHPGHGGHGFAAGIAHPFTGIDHICTMVAIGLWAMQLGGRSRWLVPLSFLATMIAGGLLALAKVQLPIVESGILASVLIMGLLLLFSLRLPLLPAVALVALFAIFHGYAHMAEMPSNAATLAYGTGFVIATSILLSIGLFLGALFTSLRQPNWLRACGAAVTAAAFVLALG